MTRVSTAPSALDQLLYAGRWWRRAHRPPATREAASAYESEIGAAYEILRRWPEAGRRFPTAGRRGVRRLLLPLTRFHIYYVYLSRRDEVLVVAVWSAVRGQPPRVDVPRAGGPPC